MADVNKVILIGRLTRDPQLKYLPSQTAVCEFGLAVGRKFKAASGEMREETTFVDCAVFAKGAEIFQQYMAKGKQVYVEGRLKLDQWEDKQGGGKRSKMSVVVENFQFLGDRGGAGGGQQGGGEYDPGQAPARPPQNRGPQRAPQQAPQQAPYDDSQGQQFTEDDIPF
ncbi:MAG: single-stranded DNA-binding protein [Chryseolinea sp.]